MVSKSIIAILSIFALLSNSTAIQTIRLNDNKGCECRWFGYSCKISIPAIGNKACKCYGPIRRFQYILANARCHGEAVDCANPESPYCKNPDTSYLSCLQGRGHCDDYPKFIDFKREGCKCSYSSGVTRGGCHVTHRAPDNYACRCHYLGAWTCKGVVELCDDFNHPKCKHPDTSLESCKNGRGAPGGVGYGDCSAY